MISVDMNWHISASLGYLLYMTYRYSVSRLHCSPFKNLNLSYSQLRLLANIPTQSCISQRSTQMKSLKEKELDLLKFFKDSLLIYILEMLVSSGS